MSNWPAGTVAMATVRGIRNVRVTRLSNGLWVSADPSSTGSRINTDEQVTDVRRLVVLDLPDEAWALAVRTLRATGYSYDAKAADQIEEQTKPLRIPEPGLWGVVVAWDGRHYLRINSAWRHIGGNRVTWDEIADPVRIRPGIGDEE